MSSILKESCQNLEEIYHQDVCGVISGAFHAQTSKINLLCKEIEPWLLIIYTFIVTSCIFLLAKFISYLCEIGLTQRLWHLFRSLPFVRQTVAKRMKNTTADIEDMLYKGLENRKFIKNLPKNAWTSDKILKEVQEYLSMGSFDFKKGYVSGAVYPGNDVGLPQLMQKVYGLSAYSNPLHPDVFPGIRIMEAEIIKIVSSLFRAPEAIGTVTTGGTESIFMVCKAYRDYAKLTKRIIAPNMVIPETAHAAFDKAAHMLKIRVKHAKMNPETTKVDMKSMKRLIDANTCMLVGSTPAFPHGAMDDIEKIGELGSKYSIPVHVDACLGGFLIPFMRKAGFEIPDFDFTVKGVTSISVDTHKYAYAPKGTSVILYKEKKYRHCQFSVQTDWPGGIYGTPNISGSRSGGLIATCWASLLYHGEEQYVEATKKIITTAKYIEQGLRNIEGVFVLGRPQVSVIAIGSNDFDIYRLSAALSDRGWNLNALQFPSGFHFCVTLQHTYDGVADKFLKDIRECTKDILGDPGKKATGTAAIYGMAQQIPDRSLVSEIVWAYLDACYNLK